LKKLAEPTIRIACLYAALEMIENSRTKLLQALDAAQRNS
jgi:hypothetical protein